MVGFVPLDVTDEESLDHVLMQVDHAMQYGASAACAARLIAHAAPLPPMRDAM